jgi:hypothetical protein
MATCYDHDFAQWAGDTAQLLRERHWDAVDWEHLIEEVEDLGKSERRAIASQLERLLLHLLKWQYQPHRRSDSWLDSITDARSQIRRTLEDSPSLQPFPQKILDKEYDQARRGAARQTAIDIITFPASCPYGIAQVLDPDWLP